MTQSPLLAIPGVTRHACLVPPFPAAAAKLRDQDTCAAEHNKLNMSVQGWNTHDTFYAVLHFSTGRSRLIPPFSNQQTAKVARKNVPSSSSE